MSLLFKRTNSNSLLIKQKSPVELKDLLIYDTFLLGSEHEGAIKFERRFTPNNLNNEFLQHRSRTWIIVDEFVFVFDKSLSVQI
jgi:hypothetical protein